MSAPAWFWPPSGAVARGVALTPYGASGVYVPDWRNTLLWPFFQAASGSVAVSGGNPALSLGIVDAVSDGASGLWALGWTGTLWRVASGGTVTANALPSGVYGGVAVAGGQPYSLSVASGQVYASGATLVGNFGQSAYGLVASGSTLYSLLTGAGLGTLVGTMAVPGGATGSITLPAAITAPSVLWGQAASPVLVGGQASLPALSGSLAFSFDPATSTQMLGVGSGTATIWNLASGGTDNWVFSQTVTGLANLGAVSWLPNGVQAIGTGGGSVQVLHYVASVLSLQQTLSLSAAGAIAAFSTSTDALVCRSGANVVTPLTAAASVWSVSGSSLSLTGAAAIAVTGPLAASVGFASGVATVTQINGIWSITATGALGFAPTTAAADTQGIVYFGGASGTSGVYAVCSGTTVLTSGIIASGVPTSMVVDAGRWVMGVPSQKLLVYGQTAPNVWSQQASGLAATGANMGLGVGGQTLFAGTVSQTILFNFLGAPIYKPQRVATGFVGIYSGTGSTWVTGALGTGNQPAALGVDVSGNIIAGCYNNALFTLDPTAGTVLSSGFVGQYPGQIPLTQMGLSAFLFSGSGVYAATSMAGDLVQVA